MALHVVDCPMTNKDPKARTSCVCDAWEGMAERVVPEGGVTIEGTEISTPIPHLENETVLPPDDL